MSNLREMPRANQGEGASDKKPEYYNQDLGECWVIFGNPDEAQRAYDLVKKAQKEMNPKNPLFNEAAFAGASMDNKNPNGLEVDFYKADASRRKELFNFFKDRGLTPEGGIRTRADWRGGQDEVPFKRAA